MGKHETLPFKMTVERGRLVPATPYDAERLDTWRNGTMVNVTFVRDGGRVMERKWWAVLNRAVKECKTPWKNAAEASEAVKLAIGVVNYTKTVGGEFLIYPKSLTELDDPELDDAVRDMLDVVHAVTGVDPEEWKKQVAHIRDDDNTQSAESSPVDGSDGMEPENLAAVAASDSPVPREEGANPGQVTTAEPESPSSAPFNAITKNLALECRDKFLALATDSALDGEKRAEEIGRAADAWVEALPDHRGFVAAAYKSAKQVMRGEITKAKAGEYLNRLISGGAS